MKSEFEKLMERHLGPRGVLPENQINAHLGDEPIMRVGVPQRSGALALNATLKQYPVMVSANAYWDPKKQCFNIPEHTPLIDANVAVDSAGFVAMMLFKSKGLQSGMCGVFPWSYEQYLTFANLMRPAWYSAPDMCCEPQAVSGQDEIDWRIDATGTLLEGCMRVLYEWQDQLAKGGCNTQTITDLVRIPVPIVQGWSISDYLASLELTLQVWERWQPWVAPPALMGLGSVCRRDLHHPEHGLFAILEQLEGRLPKGTKLHLFGVKGAALDRVRMYDFVASFDSMGWDYGARRQALRSGMSNTMGHRIGKMNEWMSKATERMRPKAGDQFRLSF
ncbi:hypothetical protein [Paraburkholderia sp. J8-2]|uniref:deazapurine DNA modification protein DpdA family protein n=1 Tax=Paraburkholderia sp. J8-2 TaxID=2805440 RepID=UPI002AB792CA|nr:hypothetical protein [Paraburkholderia sp. J8-2]